MKTKVAFLASALPAVLFTSCFSPVPAVHEPAVLRLSLSDEALTRASSVYIADYVLSLKSLGGKSVFKGRWGECPGQFELEPGTYAVSLVSEELEGPAFDSPQYGDSRTVNLAEGQVAEVELIASQLNAGLRLQVSDAFVASYKEGSLFLRSALGTLAFGYGETRTAYFFPGPVSILLNHKGKTTVVHTVELSAAQMLTLRLGLSETMPSAVPVSGMELRVRTDTSRMWTEESFAWDGSDGSGSGSSQLPSAVSVSAARAMAGSKDVWVCGYIVGGDLSSKSCSFEGPFSSRTNLVIADVASCTDRDRCMSVQLSVGDIRNALNLVDNPSMLGRKVWLRGDVVEAYYKIPGLQNLSDYRL